MANHWFKFYGGEYLSDPKMLALTASERSCWITLLCYASQTEGVVKHLSESTLIAQAGIDFQDDEFERTQNVLKRFVELDMIRLDNEMITVLNWKKRQEVNLTGYERVKRWREKKKLSSPLSDNEMITSEERAVIINDNGRREEKRKEPKDFFKKNPPERKTRTTKDGKTEEFVVGQGWV